ncbi:MAG: Fe-S cluster assembly protein SufD [Actinomycetaceae bacterium]|nr:Fe-S cluster assembly protein SufD [Actinomycetaceae bacterium]
MRTDHSKATLASEGISQQQSKVASSRADRLSTFDLAKMPVPTGREEDWRFTPLDRVAHLFDEKISGTAPRIDHVHGNNIEVETYANDFQPVVGAPGDRAAVVSWNSAAQKTVLKLAKDTQAQEAELFDIVGTGTESAAQRIVLEIGEHAAATVVFSHKGNANVTQTLEINVAEGAQLTFVSIQEWDSESTHAANHRIRLGKDASIKHVVISFGGKTVRICPDVEYAGEGGSCEMLGLYYTDAHQHHEHRLFVDHSVANCYSRVTYKGALQGAGAHAVWVGDVLIGAQAFGTDSYESNRNLILTPGALADSIPNLEIENGEIAGAGHASAIGHFEEEHLFYLMSRGIDEGTARRLVIHGYFGELIGQIGVPDIEAHLMTLVEAELEGATLA